MRHDIVTLDGSGSSDPNGNTPLTFVWTITFAPAGSTASLDDPTAVMPTFVVDLHADYTVELVVTNAVGASSAPDQVVISTVNTAPVADAGPDQALLVLNQPVALDGTASTDDDGDPLLYAWSLLGAPPESAAPLMNPTSATPTLTPDLYGTYTIQLVVTDVPLGAPSAPDTVMVSFDNLPPVADAGHNDSVIVGETVYLDGGGSRDPNLDPLAFTWTFTTTPPESAAAFDATAAMPTFVADVPDTFTMSLTVNDGLLDSEADSVTVQALTPAMAAELLVMEAVDAVNLVPPDSFKNANQANTLTNTINAALSNLATGNIEAGLNQLTGGGVIRKVDGCATLGSPDRNDWITSCADQAPVYQVLSDAIALLAAERDLK